MLKHRHGGDIYSTAFRIDYSANINPLGTPAGVTEAAQKSILECAHYPDVECRALKNAIAEKEHIKGESILCGNGAAELIFAIVQAEKPQKALLIAPGFAEYEQALRAAGCEVQFYQLKKENGFQYEAAYRDHLTEDLDMIFLCNPNNPTGLLIPGKEILQILQICQEKQIRVVLDSCFIDFLEKKEDADYTGYLEKFPCLFILKAFTKIYAMAGLRLGYGMSRDTRLLSRMKEAVQPWSVSIPAQAAGIAALKEELFVKQSRDLVQRERRWLKKKLEELGLWVCDSKANYVFFQGPEDLAERAKEEGILIRDCSNYHGLTNGFYRIAVRTEEENKELVRVFQKVLKHAERRN